MRLVDYMELVKKGEFLFEFQRSRLEDEPFLCKKGAWFFVSTIGLLTNPDSSMPANCVHNFSPACLYVDNVGGRCCVPIDNLEGLWHINEDGEPDGV